MVFGVQGKARRRGMVIPFQGVATQSCAAKIVQAARSELIQKGESQVIPKIVVGHGVKLINERSTAGFK